MKHLLHLISREIKMIKIGKILTSLLMIFIFVFLFMYFFISLASFMRHKYQGEECHLLCLNEVYLRLVFGLEGGQKFPANEEELKKLIYAEPMVCKSKVRYRLIDEKDNKVIFLIVVDTTKEFDLFTHQGLVTPGIGQAEKDEKGEWQITIEWFLRERTYVKKF